MPIHEPYIVLTLECGEPGHADPTSVASFRGPDRESALAAALATGWVNDRTTGTRCPVHAVPEDGGIRDTLRLAARNREVGHRIACDYGAQLMVARAAQAAAELGEWIEAEQPDVSVRSAPELPGSGSVRIEGDGPQARILGSLWILGLSRSSDWITPPGTGLDGFTTYDVVSTPNASSLGREAQFRQSPRGLFEEALRAGGGLDGLPHSLSRRMALQWRIDDVDVWGAVFAHHGGTVWWERAAAEHTEAGVRYARAAMKVFAEAYVRHLLQQAEEKALAAARRQEARIPRSR